MKNQDYEPVVKKKQLMAILNCTPDSFYTPSCCVDSSSAIARGHLFIEQGADIIDIGGESTRPFSEPIPLEIERQRVIPVIRSFDLAQVQLSIDTTKWQIASEAIHHGASLINDISGLSDPSMRSLLVGTKVKAVLMHMQGTPTTMQQAPYYPRGVVTELLEWFEKRLDVCIKEGIDPSQLILDPGIGFGKSVQDNLTILKNLAAFHRLGLPLLIGLSRKSFMAHTIAKNSSELLSTTIALNTMSLLSGVSIIRVHDVVEHRDVLDMLHSLGV